MSIWLAGCAWTYPRTEPSEAMALGVGTLEDRYRKVRAAEIRGDDWEQQRDLLRAEAARRLLSMEVITDAEADLIVSGRISRGMPLAGVWWAWGPPWTEDSNRSPYGHVVTWKWTSGKQTVTFRDGEVQWWNIID